jgi:hypothetical protein
LHLSVHLIIEEMKIALLFTPSPKKNTDFAWTF